MSRLSDELLAQARMLARRDSRRPKDSSLRRSISASYYCLFHFLGEECTRLTVGSAHDRAIFRNFASRAFVHGKMKAVCEEFAKTTPRNALLKPFWNPPWSVGKNPEVQIIALNFVALQDQRHAADYDLSQHFTRQDADVAIGWAQDACRAWARLKTSQEEVALLLALSLMLWPSLGGRST